MSHLRLVSHPLTPQAVCPASGPGGRPVPVDTRHRALPRHGCVFAGLGLSFDAERGLSSALVLLGLAVSCSTTCGLRLSDCPRQWGLPPLSVAFPRKFEVFFFGLRSWGEQGRVWGARHSDGAALLFALHASAARPVPRCPWDSARRVPRGPAARPRPCSPATGMLASAWVRTRISAGMWPSGLEPIG